jgi:hypothetical protein
MSFLPALKDPKPPSVRKLKLTSNPASLSLRGAVSSCVSLANSPRHLPAQRSSSFLLEYEKSPSGRNDLAPKTSKHEDDSRGISSVTEQHDGGAEMHLLPRSQSCSVQDDGAAISTSPENTKDDTGGVSNHQEFPHPDGNLISSLLKDTTIKSTSSTAVISRKHGLPQAKMSSASCSQLPTFVSEQSSNIEPQLLEKSTDSLTSSEQRVHSNMPEFPQPEGNMVSSLLVPLEKTGHRNKQEFPQPEGNMVSSLLAPLEKTGHRNMQEFPQPDGNMVSSLLVPSEQRGLGYMQEFPQPEGNMVSSLLVPVLQTNDSVAAEKSNLQEFPKPEGNIVSSLLQPTMQTRHDEINGLITAAMQELTQVENNASNLMDLCQQSQWQCATSKVQEFPKPEGNLVSTLQKSGSDFHETIQRSVTALRSADSSAAEKELRMSAYSSSGYIEI